MSTVLSLILVVLLLMMLVPCDGIILSSTRRGYLKTTASSISTTSRCAVNDNTGVGNRRVRSSSSSSSSSSKTDSIRQSRVARSIRDELTDIICNVDIKANAYPDEDLLKATSIVDVDISSDLSYAKVYITVLGNAVAKRQVFVWLCDNIGQVRYSLAKRMRHMRRCPEIFIKLADGTSSHLLSVMDEIAATANGNGGDVQYEYFEEGNDDNDNDDNDNDDNDNNE